MEEIKEEMMGMGLKRVRIIKGVTEEAVYGYTCH